MRPRHRAVRDIWDDRWTVYQIRPTSHGWPVLLGKPAIRERGPDRRGGNRVIVTQPLADYLQECRYARGSIRLPIGGTTIKRLRRVLGHNIYDDMLDWWVDHSDDLLALTKGEFGRRYGFSPARASQMQVAFFGRRLRPNNWWRKPPASDLLRGDLPRAYVADRLGISAGSVGRLRWILRHQDGK
jgi:hypothetical protein